MSAKVTDSIFYTDISYDTSIVDNWYNLYYEMYNAAYDTTLFITQDSIFQYSFPKVLNDTIPIGILHWKYNKLKPGALDTNLYFRFDTVNNVVYDLVPQPISPYTVETIFAASPLTRDVTFANLTFQVTPDLFFTDPTTIYGPDNRILKIDFDDGNGWVEFDPYIVTNHSVIYSSVGWKLIKTAVFDPGGNLLNHSNSVINILTTTVTIPPDDVITDIEGLDIGIYDNNCNPNAMKRYVIYLEGADILENRQVPEIYNDMIRLDRIAQLRNFGYTFVVVSWQNSGDSIQANARRVAELLE